MRFRLCDEDRVRLKLDQEWVEYTADKLMMSEAEQLDSAGYEPDEFLEDLVGHPVYDADGAPVMVPVTDDDGEPVLGDDGEPEMAQKRRFPLRQVRAAAWLAVRRAGLKVDYRNFDFNVTSMRTEASPDPSVGKGDTAPASAKNGSGTRPRSRRSSTSGRGKSSS